MINVIKFILFLNISIIVFFFLPPYYFINTFNLKQIINNFKHQKSSSLKSTLHTPQEVGAIFNKAKSERLTNTAKFISGIKVDSHSHLAQFQNNDSWLRHQRAFENAWSKLEIQQLKKVRQWSQQELKQINAASPSIVYPFSGPDFLYAYSFFPRGKEYVLAGLEPVGSVPDLTSLSESQRSLKLQEIRSSLDTILQFSFFRTQDMKVDLQKQGVLAILYVFLARTHNRILDVQQVGIDQNANIQPFKKKMIPGVKIAFVPEGESQPRTLYYFSKDLSNKGLQNQQQFSKFVSRLDKRVTYLKAASYLMYSNNFSQIKKLILAQSRHILQDDSGIPLKDFDHSKWILKFYGVYTSPVPVFAHNYQPDLKKSYLRGKSIKPLNFGIGYQYGVNNSNLMVADMKNISVSHK